MENSEFIHNLENMAVPEQENATHQRVLRVALINSEEFQTKENYMLFSPKKLAFALSGVVVVLLVAVYVSINGLPGKQNNPQYTNKNIPSESKIGLEDTASSTDREVTFPIRGGLGSNSEGIGESTPTITKTITKEDKKFINEQVGISFAYPGSWYLENASGENNNWALYASILPIGYTSEDAGANSILFYLAQDISEDDFISREMKIDAPRVKTVAKSTLNGQPANLYIISPVKNSVASYTNYFLISNLGGNLYTLSCTDNSSSVCDQAVFNKVAQSFKISKAIDYYPYANWYPYINGNVGFSLNLPLAFKGYKVEMGTDKTFPDMRNWNFQVPFKTQNNTIDYASVFIISAYTKADWNIISKEEGPKPEKVGETSTMVFGISFWQDPPMSLVGVNLGFDKIKASFKTME